MYTKWARKLGYKGRVVEKRSSTNGGLKSATIEFEYEFAYGYLSGEAGVHYIISSKNGSAVHKVQLCSVLNSIPIQKFSELLVLSFPEKRIHW